MNCFKCDIAVSTCENDNDKLATFIRLRRLMCKAVSYADAVFSVFAYYFNVEKHVFKKHAIPPVLCMTCMAHICGVDLESAQLEEQLQQAEDSHKNWTSWSSLTKLCGIPNCAPRVNWLLQTSGYGGLYAGDLLQMRRTHGTTNVRVSTCPSVFVNITAMTDKQCLFVRFHGAESNNEPPWQLTVHLTRTSVLPTYEYTAELVDEQEGFWNVQLGTLLPPGKRACSVQVLHDDNTIADTFHFLNPADNPASITFLCVAIFSREYVDLLYVNLARFLV